MQCAFAAQLPILVALYIETTYSSEEVKVDWGTLIYSLLLILIPVVSRKSVACLWTPINEVSALPTLAFTSVHRGAGKPIRYTRTSVTRRALLTTWSKRPLDQSRRSSFLLFFFALAAGGGDFEAESPPRNHITLYNAQNNPQR